MLFLRSLSDLIALLIPELSLSHAQASGLLLSPFFFPLVFLANYPSSNLPKSNASCSTFAPSFPSASGHQIWDAETADFRDDQCC